MRGRSFRCAPSTIAAATPQREGRRARRSRAMRPTARHQLGATRLQSAWGRQATWPPDGAESHSQPAPAPATVELENNDHGSERGYVMINRLRGLGIVL